jgi:Protein of unknown function (DUF1569)
MKTLARHEHFVEILRRLRTVRPENAARWGRMSAHQMVCHLADSCRVAIGQRTASRATGPLQRTLVKWIALYAPLRWPAGIPTRPEVDQFCDGTRPGDFAADVTELEALLELMLARADGRHFAEHPVFGRMSPRAWLRWAYLHADHHLRQFGA